MASCASIMPPGQVTIPDLPPILSEKPLAFRLHKPLTPMSPTPPAAALGGNSRQCGMSLTHICKQSQMRPNSFSEDVHQKKQEGIGMPDVDSYMLP